MANEAKQDKPANGYTVGEILGVAVASALGVAAAIAIDYAQRGEASALFTLSQWAVAAGRTFGLGDAPLLSVIAGLILLGALCAVGFRPATRRSAFAIGFGVLAALMIATPPKLAGGIEPIAAEARGSAEAGLRARPVAFVADRTRAPIGSAASVSEAAADRYDLRLTAHFPNGFPRDVAAMIRRGKIRGRLHNEATGETYDLFRSAGGTIAMDADTLVVRTGLPAAAPSAPLWLRIEAAGYAIEIQSAEARLGAMLDWRVEMRRSRTPPFFQRLAKSYWF